MRKLLETLKQRFDTSSWCLVSQSHFSWCKTQPYWCLCFIYLSANICLKESLVLSFSSELAQCLKASREEATLRNMLNMKNLKIAESVSVSCQFNPYFSKPVSVDWEIPFV